MKESSNYIDKKSMFSVNTMMSMQTDNSLKNNLSTYYNLLLAEHCQQYPYLSKVLFLQLILSQHLLLYTQRRIVVKDVWVTLSKNLMATSPNIYIIDSNTAIEDIFKNKPLLQNDRYMFLDLHQISNKGINYILNDLPSTTSIMSVEPITSIIQPQLTSIFTLCFKDDDEDANLEGIIQAMHKKIHQLEFKQKEFYQHIKLCQQQADKNQQEDGFLKIYINRINEKVNAKGINIIHSKWKKTLKALKFIAATKFEGTFKKFSLPDCCLAHHLLASNLEQLDILTKVNEKTVIQLIPYYGAHKFRKNIKDHFWLKQESKDYYYSIAQKMDSFVSFFYPCSKYPDTVSIKCDNQFYRIHGYDKKLMSDKFIEVDTKLSYTLSIKFKTSTKMINHFGLACYDSEKQLIQPVQVCRKNNSQVMITHIQDDKIYVKGQSNLINWAQLNNNVYPFAYQRCIGVYSDGQIDQVLPIDSIIMDQKQAYSQKPQNGAYINIGPNFIQLTPIAKKWVFMKPNLIRPGKTILMNHYQGGTYVIGKTINNYIQEWEQIQITFKGQSRQNNGQSFFPTTRYIRIVIMSNYNSGHPNYQINSKDAFMQFKDPKWFSTV